MAIQERFIGALLKPDPKTLNPARMAIGEPGLPESFEWGEETVRIHQKIRTWKEAGPCRNGSAEKYVRKHWFEVETEAHGRLKIYFERQARGKAVKKRWWLYSQCI